MSTKDSLHRFIFDKAPVRGEFVHLHESYRTIVAQHNYPEPIRRLMGEALCVAGLLTAIIKFDGRLTVQFRGSGKLKLLLAQCDNKFQLRGLAKWDGGDNISYDDLMDAFEDGVLMISLDSGANVNSYQGIVAWSGRSLAESIEGYFKNSEQLATKIWLSVSDEAAAGLLLQVVPAGQAMSSSVNAELIAPHWDHAVKSAAKLDPADLLTTHYETILRDLYPDEDIRLFPSVELKFNCTCSRQRSEDAIRVLGREEAEEEIRDKNSLIVTCDFCNRQYVFDSVDLASIFSGHQDGLPPDTHLH